MFLLSLGLPGGDQVDGLPPAASTDCVAASWPAGRLGPHFREFWNFFNFLAFDGKNLKISDIS